jgi:hypothetical protein
MKRFKPSLGPALTWRKHDMLLFLLRIILSFGILTTVALGRTRYKNKL